MYNVDLRKNDRHTGYTMNLSSIIDGCESFKMSLTHCLYILEEELIKLPTIMQEMDAQTGIPARTRHPDRELGHRSRDPFAVSRTRFGRSSKVEEAEPGYPTTND
jgi:hypothetical protein